MLLNLAPFELLQLPQVPEPHTVVISSGGQVVTLEENVNAIIFEYIKIIPPRRHPETPAEISFMIFPILFHLNMIRVRCMFKLCFKYTSGGKLAHLMTHLVPQLGEHIKGSAMPAKGVHCQRYEGDAFRCAAVVVLGHLEVVGVPHAVFPIKSHLFDETGSSL